MKAPLFPGNVHELHKSSNRLLKGSSRVTSKLESCEFPTNDCLGIVEAVVGVVKGYTEEELIGKAGGNVVAVASRNDRSMSWSESADVLEVDTDTSDVGNACNVAKSRELGEQTLFGLRQVIRADVLDSLGNSDKKLACLESECLSVLLDSNDNTVLVPLDTCDMPKLLDTVESWDGGDVSRVPVELRDERKESSEVVLLSEQSERLEKFLGHRVGNKCIALVDPRVLGKDILTVGLHRTSNSVLVFRGLGLVWRRDGNTERKVILLVRLDGLGVFKDNDSNVGKRLCLGVDVCLSVAADLVLLLNHGNLCACIFEVDGCVDT
ncbi:hypothetical protein HG531_012332 [Fusarium graminearum]|nr:hypothetical protein HG531_012332 [Fusarium graminearum]